MGIKSALGDYSLYFKGIDTLSKYWSERELLH